MQRESGKGSQVQRASGKGSRVQRESGKGSQVEGYHVDGERGIMCRPGIPITRVSEGERESD